MSRSVLRSLPWLMVLLGACAPVEAPRYTRLEGFPREHRLAKAGVPLTFEVHFFDASGAPVEPGWFQWLGAANPMLAADPGAVEVTREEAPGLRRVTLVPHALGSLSLEAIARPCPSCEETRFGPLDFWVSAEADQIAVVNENPSSMTVGERRPFAAVGWAVSSIHGFPAATAMRTPDPVALTVADPAIASVDAHGVVTAKATGTTTLTFVVGKATTSIQLDVVAGAVGKPAVGTHPILGGVRGLSQVKTDHLLVVDEREWPTFVFRPWLENRFFNPPAIVAAWTGSGFGAELLGSPFEWVTDAFIAADVRGRIYVTYMASGPTPLQGPPRIAIAERPAAGGPADWTTRELPRRPVMSSGAELDPWYDIAPDRSQFSGLVSLLARKGQGLWIAYRVWGANPSGTSGADGCAYTLRLAQVTDAQITAEDVETLIGDAEGCLGHGRTPEYHDLYVVPPLTADGTPRVALMRPEALGEQYDHVVQFSREATGWSAPVRVVPPAAPQFDNLSVYGVKSVGLVQPVPLFGEPTWVKTGIYQGEVDDIFSFRGLGQSWVGHAFLRPLEHSGPYGTIGSDDPAALLGPSEIATQDTWVARWPFRGGALSPSRLNFAAEPTQAKFVFSTVEPARLALHTDPEALGTRLTTEAVTPVGVDPVVVLDGGARIVTLERFDRPTWDSWEPPSGTPLAPVVLRSAGPDQPYLPVAVPAGLVSGAWLDLGGTVVGLARDASGPLQVVRLSANSATEVITSTPASGYPLAAQALGRALFVLVPPAAGTPSLLASLDPLAGAPFTDLLSGVATASLLDADPSHHALLPRPATSEVYLLSRQVNAPGHLRLHVFGADGTLHAANDLLVPLVGGLRPTERIRTASLAADGALYLFAISSRGATLLRSRDRLRTLEVAAEWTEQWYPPTNLAQLSDGRLAFAASRRVAPDVWKVALWTSLDGSTWSGPTLVRPDGGNGQRPAAVSPEPTGGALVLLHDNGSLRAWGLTCGLNSTEVNLAGPEAVVVRVP